MTVDIVLGWPQVVVLFFFLVAFGYYCAMIPHGRQAKMSAVIGIAWIAMTLLTFTAMGFFSP